MPGGFDVAWAESLRPACRDHAFGLPVLTCHHREEDFESICAGFLNDQVRNGIPNLNVRLALLQECIKLPEENPELLSYEELIKAMRADPTARGK